MSTAIDSRTVDQARKHLESAIRSLRSMERLRCSPYACDATAQIVEANIDALIAAAKREVVQAEVAGLAEAASIVSESDPKLGGES